jgi:hypothetical protein
MPVAQGFVRERPFVAFTRRVRPDARPQVSDEPCASVELCPRLAGKDACPTAGEPNEVMAKLEPRVSDEPCATEFGNNRDARVLRTG